MAFSLNRNDLRANGQPAGGRRIDDREVAHARHGHLQRAGIGVAVSVNTSTWVRNCFETFLVFHAEPLFLVDDDESEVAELHVLLQQTVGADEHIDDARRRVLDNRFGLLGRLKSGQEGDTGGKGRKPFREVVVMLVRQQRGRHQHGHLAIFFHGLESGPHGHLGLAVPHIAADEAVHRFGGGHVIRDVFNGPALIRRFLILEGRLELVVQHAVFAVRRSVDQFPIGIEIDELVRHFLDVFFDPRGGLRPAGAAQPIQAGTWASAPAYRWTWFSRSRGT